MKLYNIVIETPKGSREKYHYDPSKNTFTFKKALAAGLYFPHDFGFIPDTKGQDGDPLDALVISEFTTFPGCHINCRLIGAVTAKQDDGKKSVRNDRYFFIPEPSLQFQHIRSITDFPAQYLKELIFFFMIYNEAENKKFDPLKILDKRKARALLQPYLPTEAATTA